MYKLQKSFITPPTINPADPILAMEFSAGALHQQVLTSDKQTRTYLTKIITPPQVVDVSGTPRFEMVEGTGNNQTVERWPHVYDALRDRIYVACRFVTRATYSGLGDPVRVSVLSIDPRTHTLVNRIDLEVAPVGTFVSLEAPSRMMLGTNSELHVLCGTTCFILDANTLVVTRQYTDSTFYEPLPIADQYFTMTPTTGGINVDVFLRSGSGTVTFSPLVGPILIPIAQEQPGAYYAVDRDTGNVWFLAKAVNGDATTTGQDGTVAVRWSPSSGTQVLIPKRPSDVPGQGYTTASPAVVNSKFYYCTFRPVADVGVLEGMIEVSADGLTQRYFGESPDYAPGQLYPSTDGYAYAADALDDSALYAYNLISSHKNPDIVYNAMGTARSRTPSFSQVHDTFVSVKEGIFPTSGFMANGDARPIIGIPANPSATTPIDWTITEPTVTSVITPPTQPYEVAEYGPFTFTPITNNGTSPPITPMWHRIVHTGDVTTVVYLSYPRDGVLDNATSVSIAQAVYAALYDANGRVLQRLRTAEPQYMFTGSLIDWWADSGTGVHGFVIPSYIPAGNYYIGVLSAYDDDAGGRTFFCDYQFEGYTSDRGHVETTPEVFVPMAYLLSVQTHPAEQLFNAPCLPTTYTGLYPWEELIEVNSTLTPTWNTLYDNPALDGVNFNVNLGGYAGSWTPDTPSEVRVSFMGSPTDPFVSGMEIQGSDPTSLTINLSGNSRSYELTNPTQLARYYALGSFGDAPPAPGHTVYPAVATYAGDEAYVKPRFCNAPILYEQWYSLNTQRSNKSIGYDGYTFLGEGPGPDFYLQMDSTVPGVFIRRATSGVYKLGADLATVQPAECVSVVTYVGGETGGILTAYTNGKQVYTYTFTTGPLVSLSVTASYVFNDTIVNIGAGKSLLQRITITARTLDNTETIGEVLDFDTALYDPSTNPGLIDTRFVKAGFYVDAEGGGAANTYDSRHVVDFSPGMFYAIPSRVLACQTYPDAFTYTPTPYVA